MATITAPARSSRRAERRRGRAARGAVLPVSCDPALSAIVCAALICSPRTTIRLRYFLCAGLILQSVAQSERIDKGYRRIQPRQLARSRTLHSTELRAVAVSGRASRATSLAPSVNRRHNAPARLISAYAPYGRHANFCMRKIAAIHPHWQNGAERRGRHVPRHAPARAALICCSDSGSKASASRN